ncbi:MAG: ATP synthase F1 subunit gamma [Anaerolineaceae bacterium 4572_5.1]|nr:MAG: ATP synthase F1 subunit gamma [Anaerolineaceae bacterium 4572_5.1]
MANAREVEQRIKSVKNIAQVTRALQAVSASKVKKSIQILERTRPYSTKAWQVLQRIANQPQSEGLHQLLQQPATVKNVLVVVISGDRGLAGAYYSNLMRFLQKEFEGHSANVRYITVGSKGRDILLRQGKDILAEFSDMPAAPSFVDVSPIGHLVVEEFLTHAVDEVYLVYTDFKNMIIQTPVIKKLLPLMTDGSERVNDFEDRSISPTEYIYEPGQEEILDNIIPRFTALQVFHAIVEALASEHAARMVAMKNATDNAADLASSLQLEYNKARQQTITNELLDIAGGAEALEQSL